MIFPILNGWLGPTRAPFTWMLIMLNVVMFSVTSRLAPDVQAQVEDIMQDDFFVAAQGRAYAQYVRTNPSREPAFVNRLGQMVTDGDPVRAQTLGQLAFRDQDFLARADDLELEGDQVAFGIWRARLKTLREDQAAHPSFVLGLSAADDSFASWVTYIFVHSGGFHLFGNMLFLLIFGAALEFQLGGLALVLGFLGSGVVGAGVFATVTGVTTSPLVGASGAISGVMALYCVLNWLKPVRYFWIVLPTRGFAGLTYLPAWTALVLWGAADLSGVLASLPELGGVAYAAHLGGDLAGAFIALGLLALRRDPGPKSLPTPAVLHPF